MIELENTLLKDDCENLKEYIKCIIGKESPLDFYLYTVDKKSRGKAIPLFVIHTEEILKLKGKVWETKLKRTKRKALRKK
jgi:hypothetical protein